MVAPHLSYSGDIVMHWNVTYVLMLGTVAVRVSIYVFMAIKLEECMYPHQVQNHDFFQFLNDLVSILYRLSEGDEHHWRDQHYGH